MQFPCNMHCPQCGRHPINRKGQSAFYACTACLGSFCIVDMAVVDEYQVSGETPPLYGNMDQRELDPTGISDNGVAL